MKQTHQKTHSFPHARRRSSSRLSVKALIRAVFVPGKHNHYRPHLVRSWVLLMVIAGFIAGQLSITVLHKGSVLSDSDTLPPAQLLKDTNNFRQTAGVQPLIMNDALSRAAAAKVNDMFAHQYWNHVSPSGIQPWHWIVQTGYNYQAAGENLAKNFYTADATVQAWYDSPMHRENMLNERYSDVGFATASGLLNGQKATITVAMYGQPLSQVATLSSTSASSGNGVFISSGTSGSLSMADRVGLAVQSMPPLVIGVVALLLVMLVVLVAAHSVRRQLPTSHVRHHLRYHHALIKGIGVFVFIVSIFWLYGGGQI